MKQKYTNIVISNQEHSTTQITGLIAWSELEPYYKKRLDTITQNIELDGFRKGHAPTSAVEEKVGKMEVLSGAAQDVLGDIYPAIVLENELKIIGYPQISITKMAYGSDLEFAITTAVMPEVTLGDYKTIAADANKQELVVEVTDEEFDTAVEQVTNMYAHTVQGADEQEQEGVSPELTDELVSKLGDYSSVDEFKTKFREEMKERKTNEERAKNRESMINAIAEQSTFELPEVLIDSEKEKMIAAVKDDISRMGLEYNTWLEHSGKTEEDMRKEMHDDAIARARADVVLKTIAQQENIAPDTEKVDTQVSAIQGVHKDVPEENIRSYVENIYLNEAVLEYLESQK